MKTYCASFKCNRVEWIRLHPGKKPGGAEVGLKWIPKDVSPSTFECPDCSNVLIRTNDKKISNRKNRRTVNGQV